MTTFLNIKIPFRTKLVEGKNILLGTSPYFRWGDDFVNDLN